MDKKIEITKKRITTPPSWYSGNLDGFCECGCGGKTEISKYSQKVKGFVKGLPRKYISGHNINNGTLVDTFSEYIKKGYVYIRIPSHPNSVDGYIRKDKYLMEQYLGRYLKKREQVYHKDRDKLNNEIKNLTLDMSEMNEEEIIIPEDITPEQIKKILFNKKNRLIYKNNPMRRIHFRMSAILNYSLRSNGISKSRMKWEDIVGYTKDELAIHLESQFKDGMSWSNIGEWHIDHIIPRSYYKFSSFEDEEFKQCWSLSNLQPLWASENISKGAKIPMGVI